MANGMVKRQEVVKTLDKMCGKAAQVDGIAVGLSRNWVDSAADLLSQAVQHLYGPW